MTYYIIPSFILIVVLFSIKNKVNAYEAFIKGAKEGIEMTFKLIPYVLSMIFATSLFRASNMLTDIFSYINLSNIELYIQAIFRPLSSNAALGVMIDIFEKYGVDSKISIASSILEGSSDTTLYVISLYFGSISIKKTRYAIPCGLLADFIGFIITMLLYFLIL